MSDFLSHLPSSEQVLSPVLGPPRYAAVSVRRIEDRIGRIFRAVTVGMMDPQTRMAVTDMFKAAGCGQRDFACEVNTAFYTLRNAIKYRRDPTTVDLFPTLRRAVQAGAADCGGYTVAIMTALGLDGFPVGCRVIAQSQDWDHVYGLASYPGPHRKATQQRTMSLDLSESHSVPGWEPDHSSYRAQADFWYPAETWAEWFMRGASDLNLPPIHRAP